MSHVEGEKIPIYERHEEVAFGIVFDTDDIIMKGIVHRCPLKMDGEFQFSIIEEIVKEGVLW